MKQQFKVSFFLRKNRVNRSGNTAIYVRINLRGDTSRFSSNQYVEPEQWNEQTESVGGNKKESESTNLALESIKHRLTDCYFRLMSLETLCMQDLLREYKGEPQKEQQHTLLELIIKHNTDFAKRIGIDRTASTYQKYAITEMRIKSFLKDL